MGDVLAEVSNLPALSTEDLLRKIKYDLMAWLQSDQDSGALKNALSDIRNGLLRMAIVMDREAATVLMDQFLVKVLVTRPDVEHSMRDFIGTMIDGLQK